MSTLSDVTDDWILDTATGVMPTLVGGNYSDASWEGGCNVTSGMRGRKRENERE